MSQIESTVDRKPKKVLIPINATHNYIYVLFWSSAPQHVFSNC